MPNRPNLQPPNPRSQATAGACARCPGSRRGPLRRRLRRFLHHVLSRRPPRPSLPSLDLVPGVHRIHHHISRHRRPRPTGIGAPITEDPDVQAWGADSHPPGCFLDILNKNIPVHAQGVSDGSSFKPIDIGDNTNVADCGRTHMLWTKDEDHRLVCAWLNNSNDPIHSNYKKNDQYWKEVVAAYNSATPENRATQVQHIKDRFGRIKKKCRMVLWWLERG